MPSIAGFSVSYAWAAAWAVGAFIIYNLGSTFLINRQHAAEARRLGCAGFGQADEVTLWPRWRDESIEGRQGEAVP